MTTADRFRAMPGTIDAKDVALILGVNPVTVRRWCHAKLIPHIVIGKCSFRFDPTTLATWIESSSEVVKS